MLRLLEDRHQGVQGSHNFLHLGLLLGITGGHQASGLCGAGANQAELDKVKLVFQTSSCVLNTGGVLERECRRCRAARAASAANASRQACLVSAGSFEIAVACI